MPVVPSTTPAITLADLVAETKRHLFSSQRVEMNRLNGTITSNATTLTLDFNLDGIARGSYIEIDDELIYVWSTTGSTSVTSMQRGMLGSTAAAHTAGAIITVNPTFPAFAIKKALQEEIRSWGPQLYQVVAGTIAAATDRRGYELTEATFGKFDKVIEVRHSNQVETNSTDPRSWPRVHGWQMIRNAPTADFASGDAIVLPGTFSPPLPSIYVTVAAPFDVNTAWVDGTDMLDAVGLAESMTDIPPIGAAWRMMMTREVRRTNFDNAGDPATMRDLPPGYVSQTAARLKQLRDDRIQAEAMKLLSSLPSGGWA